MKLNLHKLAAGLGEKLNRRGWFLTTAESCTGGLVAGAVTDIAGSSTWFERGFVTYTNQAKHEMLGVPADTLTEFGAVSEQTVRAMAQGALRHSSAQIAVAISGVAGPDGGTSAKPVGLVWFAVAVSEPELKITVISRHFSGDRAEVRCQAVAFALQCLSDQVG